MAYTIKSGDTLGDIAYKNKTTVAELMRLNPNIKKANLIYAGQNLNLPTTASVVPKTPVTPTAPTTTITKQTVDDLTKKVAELAKVDPVVAPLLVNNSVDALTNAYLTNDWSAVTDSSGKPFSDADQQAAYAKGVTDLEPYYAAQKDYETKNAEDILKLRQAEYQNYLITSGADFEKQKASQDQSAANQGVLFSGGRAQKLQNLQNTFETEGQYQKTLSGTGIAGAARDYQYKYGNEAAQGLSQYYNLGGNTYNPNVATGGVGSSGLSNVYNAGSSNYQGTANVTAKSEAQKRAAGYLWNKGNKIVQGGYKNQF